MSCRYSIIILGDTWHAVYTIIILGDTWHDVYAIIILGDTWHVASFLQIMSSFRMQYDTVFLIWTYLKNVLRCT